MREKIIRSVCQFADSFDESLLEKLAATRERLVNAGYEVQTLRVCTKKQDIDALVGHGLDEVSIGTVLFDDLNKQREAFFRTETVSLNVDLTSTEITPTHVAWLFDLIEHQPNKTFNFAFVFNNPPSSPFFPSAKFTAPGFSLGLQPTNLAVGCDSLQGWLEKMRATWSELAEMFQADEDFLGIDSSVAPLFGEEGSLVAIMRRLVGSFDKSVLTDSYLRITEWIKEQNPKPIGLCGLMFPCLEDFLLAEEYEKGNFSLERNLYLSLNSGLGIDTYPIGIDEKPESVLNVLRVVQKLSNKYVKPLSVRFVSDGKAKIGQKTDFKNQYLKDVVVRPIA
ncbi:MAG: DUF711 family protein [Patescibacteria group bacterium]